MNNNLISVAHHMQKLLRELCEADVTVLATSIDMKYDTPRPHPFRFRIQVWNDVNYLQWAAQYHMTENVQCHETFVPFLDGQVFALYV